MNPNRASLATARKLAASPAKRERHPPQPERVASLAALVRDPDQLLDSADVIRLRLVPSYASLMKWLANRRFPQPTPLGERYLTWDGRELIEWLEQRREASRRASERPGQTRKRLQDQRRRQRQAPDGFGGKE
jgi:predicted DNA-binding transcriptional regulator AlpA